MKKKDDHPIWSKREERKRERRERRENKGDHKGQRVFRELYQKKNTSSVFIWVSIFPFISNLIAY